MLIIVFYNANIIDDKKFSAILVSVRFSISYIKVVER